MSPRSRPLHVIGLTGNIATGKSTVTQMLARRGACIIDCDRLAHESMRAGSEVHQRIVARFGAGVLGADGEISRQALGAIVFDDPAALADLEAIIHPWVVRETRRRLAACAAPAAVVEAIKLLEAQMHADCDEIWVVTAPHAQQLARLMERRGMSLEEAKRRIAAQPPQEDKAARADLVIENAGSLQELEAQVAAAWERLMADRNAQDQEATEQ